MFSKKLLIPLLSLSLLVTPAYSSHAAENTEAAETSVEGQGMLSPPRPIRNRVRARAWRGAAGPGTRAHRIRAPSRVRPSRTRT